MRTNVRIASRNESATLPPWAASTADARAAISAPFAWSSSAESPVRSWTHAIALPTPGTASTSPSDRRSRARSVSPMLVAAADA